MKILHQIIYWTPRILSILAIGLLFLLASDSFNPKLTLQDQLISFMMNSIPAFSLLILLVIAWKWQLWGGILFMAIGLGFAPFLFMINYQRLMASHNPAATWISIGIVMAINFPFILAGGLFVLSHFMKKKQSALKSE
jgi:hypothetical protein